MIGLLRAQRYTVEYYRQLRRERLNRWREWKMDCFNRESMFGAGMISGAVLSSGFWMIAFFHIFLPLVK